MSIKKSTDFRRKFKTGAEFSSKEEGFLVIENLELAKKNERISPLNLSLHCKFICEVLKQCGGECFWFVENPSPKTLTILQNIFPNHNVLNGSISGYFGMEEGLIYAFWNLFEKTYTQMPWQNEQAWGLVSLTEKLPTPQSQSWLQKPFWSVNHVLENHKRLHGVFVQLGWFSFFAVRPFEGLEKLLSNEFPELEK